MTQAPKMHKVHVTLELMISKDDFDCMSDLEWAVFHKIEHEIHVKQWNVADDVPFVKVELID